MKRNHNCQTCLKPLGPKNRSGYCRAHFAASVHACPVASARKAERFRASFAVSPKRPIEAARLTRLSRSRMDWCPPAYLDFYRALTRNRDFPAKEARAVVHAEIARTMAASLVRPTLRSVG